MYQVNLFKGHPDQGGQLVKIISAEDVTQHFNDQFNKKKPYGGKAKKKPTPIKGESHARKEDV